MSPQETFGSIPTLTSQTCGHNLDPRLLVNQPSRQTAQLFLRKRLEGELSVPQVRLSDL